MGEYIGINFGTTNTAVVHIIDEEYGRKVSFLGEDGKYPFSSIVAVPLDGGNILFGRAVREKRHELAQTHRVFTSMKSYLGKKESNGEPKSLDVGEQKYYPKKIVEAFFRYIREHIKRHWNIDITVASLSYPVDFSQDARSELCEAAQRAGIEVKAFVSEATAAYIANRKEGKAFSKVMVLDWGGGTFDIGVLKLTGNKIQEMAVWGDHIGGDDIDYELAERIHSQIAAKSERKGGRFEDMSPAERDYMLSICEETKIEISSYEEDYPFTIRDYGPYGTKSINISTDFFNDIVEPIIKTRILTAIDKVLGKAGGLTPSSIDCIIVVGGSSNLKVYERAITNLFNKAMIVLPENTQWATAIGAALMQIIGGTIRLNESVGVLLSDDSVFPVLPKGQAIGENTATVTFSLVEDARDAHFIFANESGKNIYARKSVPTKGFLQETIELTAVIGFDQIARIGIANKYMGTDARSSTTVELNKLSFYYDVGALGDSD